MPILNWVAQHTSCPCRYTDSLLKLKKSCFFSNSDHSRQRSPRGLLDLPTEIRLLIYEAIFTPASVVLQSGQPYAMIAVLQNFPELISRGSRDVQLFRTCRVCHDEAAPIFYTSLNLLVYQHLPLLRLNFLPRIGPLNASFIKRAIVTPIGLPGEHQRLLESLGPKHGGLVRLEHLTLEIWNPDHIPALVSTCQELMHRHENLKILFGRGIDVQDELQAGDIPARLKLAKSNQPPGYRERVIQSINVTEPPESQIQATEECSGQDVPLTGKGRHSVRLAVPEPRRTIWSRYKFRSSRRPQSWQHGVQKM